MEAAPYSDVVVEYSGVPRSVAARNSAVVDQNSYSGVVVQYKSFLLFMYQLPKVDFQPVR